MSYGFNVNQLFARRYVRLSFSNVINCTRKTTLMHIISCVQHNDRRSTVCNLFLCFSLFIMVSFEWQNIFISPNCNFTVKSERYVSFKSINISSSTATQYNDNTLEINSIAFEQGPLDWFILPLSSVKYSQKKSILYHRPSVQLIINVQSSKRKVVVVYMFLEIIIALPPAVFDWKFGKIHHCRVVIQRKYTHTLHHNWKHGKSDIFVHSCAHRQGYISRIGHNHI